MSAYRTILGFDCCSKSPSRAFTTSARPGRCCCPAASDDAAVDDSVASVVVRSVTGDSATTTSTSRLSGADEDAEVRPKHATRRMATAQDGGDRGDAIMASGHDDARLGRRREGGVLTREWTCVAGHLLDAETTTNCRP